MMRMLLNFDGGGTSTPDTPASYGWVLSWEDGERVEEGNGRLTAAPVNVAEYTGLISGLRAALRYAPLQHLHVRGDSQLVLFQLTPIERFHEWHPFVDHVKLPVRPRSPFVYRCKAVELLALHKEALLLLTRVGRYRLEWVRREQNSHADALATKALHAV